MVLLVHRHFQEAQISRGNLCHRTNWSLSRMTRVFIFTLPSTVRTRSFVSDGKDEIRECPRSLLRGSTRSLHDTLVGRWRPYSDTRAPCRCGPGTRLGQFNANRRDKPVPDTPLLLLCKSTEIWRVLLLRLTSHSFTDRSC